MFISVSPRLTALNWLKMILKRRESHLFQSVEGLLSSSWLLLYLQYQKVAINLNEAFSMWRLISAPLHLL